MTLSKVYLAAVLVIGLTACSHSGVGGGESSSPALSGGGATLYSAMTDTCEIRDASGAILKAPVQTDVHHCQSACDDFGSALGRSCLFAVKDLNQALDCYILDGSGGDLTAPTSGTYGQCYQQCQAYAASPNRSCRWDGIEIADVDICTIQSATNKLLTPISLETRGQCHAQCEDYQSSDPGRVCSWSHLDAK